MNADVAVFKFQQNAITRLFLFHSVENYVNRTDAYLKEHYIKNLCRN